MSPYVIIDIEVTDLVGYEEHKRLAAPAITQEDSAKERAAKRKRTWKKNEK